MIPSVGMPLSIRDLLKITGNYFFKIKNESIVADLLKEYIGVKYCALTFMGRIGMYVTLKAISNISYEKKEVILSVLTCESVYYAIKRAGLKPVLCDTGSESVLISKEEAEKKINENTLCIIVNSMYGYTNEMDMIKKMAKVKGIFLIEDIAQNLGAEQNGIKAGSFGDASVASFGKSKNISSVLGGAVFTNDENVWNEVKKTVETLNYPDFSRRIKIILYLFISYLLIKPVVFRIITLFKKDFTTYDHEESKPLLKMTRMQLSILFLKINSLDTLNKVRTKNAENIINGIKSGQIKQLSDGKDSSVFLRLPVICLNKKLRDDLIIKLRKSGVWAMPNIFQSLNSIEEMANVGFPNIEKIKDRLLVISTHPYLKKSDILKTINVINCN